MKRALTLILGLCMLFSLASCNNQENQPTSSSDTQATDSTPAAQSYHYTWGACSSSSGYYALNVAVSDVINKNVDNVSMTVMETGGGAENLKFISESQVQFGQSSVPDIYLSSQALDAFEGTTPNENVRVMLSLLPNVYYFVVNADSGINSISDLQGKKFSPGNTNSSAERLAYAILNVLGVEPDWYYASTSEAVDAMKDRRIDGFMKSASSTAMDSSIADVKTSVDVKILTFTDEEIAKILEAYPYYSFGGVDGSIFGQEGTITSMTSYYSYAVSKDIPEDVVYNIVKALCENQSYLESAYSGLTGFNPAEITATSTSGYLHAGTIKYLTELGYKIKDDQIPPEAK
ncbi:MAG: TAXI family TRAP transporter solute-binding subunit [Bacillota bacterium]